MGNLSAADKRKVQKPLLWIGLASIVMTFAGLTSGYIVSRSALIGENRWVEFGLPPEFFYATIAIFLSSLALIIAKRSILKNQIETAGMLVLATFALGIAFLYLQLKGGASLMDQGLYFTGSNSASSWVWAVAGLHWFHAVSGIIVLIYTWYRTAILKVHTSTDHQGFSVSAIYWHFLGGLWLFLYLFLYFIR